MRKEGLCDTETEAIQSVANALWSLGLNGAITDFGAIEALSLEVGRVADGLLAISSAIRDAGEGLGRVLVSKSETP